MNEPNWPPSWTRAALELAALRAVEQAETTHGYEVARRLQSAGLGDIKGGTLYPVLARLEEQGLTHTWWVEGAGGPGRKLIAITDDGRAELQRRTVQWHSWSARVTQLLADAPARSRPEAAAATS